MKGHFDIGLIGLSIEYLISKFVCRKLWSFPNHSITKFVQLNLESSGYKAPFFSDLSLWTEQTAQYWSHLRFPPYGIPTNLSLQDFDTKCIYM